MEGRFPQASASSSSLLSPNVAASRAGSIHSQANGPDGVPVSAPQTVYSTLKSSFIGSYLSRKKYVFCSHASWPPTDTRQYSLPPSPAAWGMPLLMNDPETDDYLHNPDPRRDRVNDKGGSIFTSRGLANLGCLLILVLGCLMLL